MTMQTNSLTEIDDALTDQEKLLHLDDERIIQEYLFEFRQVMAALLRIKDRRSYRDTYTTFEGYVRAVWPDIFGDISRSYLHRQVEHERTVQAIEEENSRQMIGNVANWQQIPVPTHEAQTRPLHGMPVDDRVAGWELAVEQNGGKVPAASQVAAVAEPPKWIDARSSLPMDVTPGTHDPSAKKPEPRTTTDILCDGRRLSYNLIVPTRGGAMKWWGAISRRQWEKVGLVYKGLPQTEFEDEDDLSATEDLPDGIAPDVRAAVARERARIAAIPKPMEHLSAFFGEAVEPEKQPDPEEDAPQSFTAGMDFSAIDQTLDGGFQEYAQ